MPQFTPQLVANYAVRIFLERAGERYDQMRGLTPFIRDSSAVATVLKYFDGCCAYCEAPLTQQGTSKDHLVPINRTAVGLHAWGNVVWACNSCNGKKHHNDWRTYVRSISATDDDFVRRVSKIEGFQREFGYAPGADLAILAEALYREIQVLIDAKLKVAEATIAQLGKLDGTDDPPWDRARSRGREAVT